MVHVLIGVGFALFYTSKDIEIITSVKGHLRGRLYIGHAMQSVGGILATTNGEGVREGIPATSHSPPYAEFPIECLSISGLDSMLLHI